MSVEEAKTVHEFASRCRELRDNATRAIRDASTAEGARKQALLEAIEQFRTEETQRSLNFLQETMSCMTEFIQQEAARSDDVLAASRLHTNAQLAVAFDGWEKHRNELVEWLGSKLAAARHDLAAEQQKNQNQQPVKAKLEEENAALRLQNEALKEEIETLKEATGEHAHVREQLQQSLDRIKELEKVVQTVAAREARRKCWEAEERRQSLELEKDLKKYIK